MSIVRDAADLWTNRHPELPAVVTVGGSVDLIKRVMDGEPCDVLISADSTLFESIMGLTKNEYVVFARNKMVLVSNGKRISTGIIGLTFCATTQRLSRTSTPMAIPADTAP